MLRATRIAERTGAEGIGSLSAELQAAVRLELEAMLADPIFVQSSRCKRFLSFIVEQTLAGNGSQLKERTVGIAAFERANDYDTGDDSIVRVTANEVRKRISQFYQGSSRTHLIQIELPRGSYVPEFRIQPARRTDKPVETGAPAQVGVDPGLAANSIAEQPPSALPVGREAGVDQVQMGEVKASTRIRLRRLVVYGTLLILIAVSLAVLWTWKRSATKRVPDLWGAFLRVNAPILVCIDTHDLQPLAPEQSADGQRFVDLVLRRQIISLDDAAVLSSMASELGKRGVPFRVVGAEQTSLADLRRQPVILIGAIDNKWTLRLTQNLPYRIEVENPPGSGSGKEPIASIVDSGRPASAQWVTDLSVPFAAWKSDYAIVARIDDATTGVPVLIEAGLGNDGTIAASELITSGAMTTALANEPSCRDKINFESVIETQIIDTKSGPPHVLRLTCW
jgi:hypothetical protein